MTTTPPNDQLGDQAFRSSDNNARWLEMTYGGALSFLRRRYTRDLAGVDVAVSGIPYDAAVTYRPGCRLGPRAIRAASVQLAELDAFPYGFDPFKTLSVVDVGDCMINPHHPDTVVIASPRTRIDCLMLTYAHLRLAVIILLLTRF